MFAMAEGAAWEHDLKRLELGDVLAFEDSLRSHTTTVSHAPVP